MTLCPHQQVAAMNAQLRSLMASQHDAMSVMERLAMHQQFQKLINLNSLQQQNPLMYSHTFPAAAAAALFTGIGGIGASLSLNNEKWELGSPFHRL
jgi:hypothetical protein